MNFEYMPELKSPAAYPIALMVIDAACHNNGLLLLAGWVVSLNPARSWISICLRSVINLAETTETAVQTARPNIDWMRRQPKLARINESTKGRILQA